MEKIIEYQEGIVSCHDVPFTLQLVALFLVSIRNRSSLNHVFHLYLFNFNHAFRSMSSPVRTNIEVEKMREFGSKILFSQLGLSWNFSIKWPSNWLLFKNHLMIYFLKDPDIFRGKNLNIFVLRLSMKK